MCLAGFESGPTSSGELVRGLRQKFCGMTRVRLLQSSMRSNLKWHGTKLDGQHQCRCPIACRITCSEQAKVDCLKAVERPNEGASWSQVALEVRAVAAAALKGPLCAAAARCKLCLDQCLDQCSIHRIFVQVRVGQVRSLQGGQLLLGLWVRFENAPGGQQRTGPSTGHGFPHPRQNGKPNGF